MKKVLAANWIFAARSAAPARPAATQVKASLWRPSPVRLRALQPVEARID